MGPITSEEINVLIYCVSWPSFSALISDEHRRASDSRDRCAHDRCAHQLVSAT